MSLVKARLRTCYILVVSIVVLIIHAIFTLTISDNSMFTVPIKESMVLPLEILYWIGLVIGVIFLAILLMELPKTRAFYKIWQLLELMTDGATTDFERTLPDGRRFKLSPPKDKNKPYQLSLVSMQVAVIELYTFPALYECVEVLSMPSGYERELATTFEFRNVHKWLTEVFATSTA